MCSLPSIPMYLISILPSPLVLKDLWSLPAPLAIPRQALNLMLPSLFPCDFPSSFPTLSAPCPVVFLFHPEFSLWLCGRWMVTGNFQRCLSGSCHGWWRCVLSLSLLNAAPFHPTSFPFRLRVCHTEDRLCPPSWSPHVTFKVPSHSSCCRG